MLLVILGIALIFLAIGIGLYVKLPPYGKRTEKQNLAMGVCTTIGSIIAAITLCAILILSMTLSGRMTIDDKITMYQEENAAIEEQITTIVTQYQDYETGIFTELKPEKSIALVTLYPELKSDTLVQKQIEIYTANNQNIKALKAEKLNYKPIAWWLYFGN